MVMTKTSKFFFQSEKFVQLHYSTLDNNSKISEVQ